MLLFNGLYFKGEWAQQFAPVEELSSFNAPKGKQEVKFIKANGLYKYADISSQNLIAVEIPYKVIELDFSCFSKNNLWVNLISV